jgi:hypothetical protein
VIHDSLFLSFSPRDARAGAGEKQLATTKDFSKWGRVNHALTRRIALLAEVDRLGASLGVPGDVGYTAETAEYFRLYHVQSRVEEFRARFRVPPPPVLEGTGETTGFDVVKANPAASEEGGAIVPAATGGGGGTAEALAAARIAYRRTVAQAAAAITPASAVADAFPFPAFFATAPGGLQAIFVRT